MAKPRETILLVDPKANLVGFTSSNAFERNHHHGAFASNGTNSPPVDPSSRCVSSVPPSSLLPVRRLPCSAFSFFVSRCSSLELERRGPRRSGGAGQPQGRHTTDGSDAHCTATIAEPADRRTHPRAGRLFVSESTRLQPLSLRVFFASSSASLRRPNIAATPTHGHTGRGRNTKEGRHTNSQSVRRGVAAHLLRCMRPVCARFSLPSSTPHPTLLPAGRRRARSRDPSAR